MSARKIGYATNIAVLVASGTYVFVYLYRWEWNRALMAGVLFVAAEVALAAALILDRLRAPETRALGVATGSAKRSGAPAGEAGWTALDPLGPSGLAEVSPEHSAALFAPAENGRAARAGADPQVLAHIEQTAPPARDHFQWLVRDAGGLNVFVPVLMGAGVVLSGLAWLVERFAHATARPALERGLAARLAPLSLPPGGLVAAEEDHLAILLGPRRARR